ncbi:MAG: YigZ family protein [Methylococcaceae bacterium]|nr:YigZ family protein [Methylococcaceae bacterium]
MRCVSAEHRIEEIIKKSRFIGVITPGLTEQAALQVIAQLHIEHPHASHIAFAYRVQSADGIRYRFHDAGEPSGTAGKPIYQHLEGKNLINVVLAVIRYFGGVKLGAGGLTRAYGNAAGTVIESAAIIDYIPLHTLHLTLDYQQLQAFEYYLKKYAGIIVQQEFTAQVQLTVELPQANVRNLLASAF